MLEDKTTAEFINELISTGGQSYGSYGSYGIKASCLVAAMGIALGEKAVGLTKETGEFRYDIDGKDDGDEDRVYIYNAEEAEYFLNDRLGKLKYMREELLYQPESDRENAENLRRALAIPEGDSSRVNVLENARRVVCASPIDVMRMSAKAISVLSELSERLGEKSLRYVVDGSLLCESAMKMTSFEIFNQTKLMVDRKYALSLEKEVKDMHERYLTISEKIQKKYNI